MHSWAPSIGTVASSQDSSLSEDHSTICSRRTLSSSGTTALAHYDPTKPLVIAADASSNGIGCAMLQLREDGSLRPVQYAAASFSDTERRYAQVEREALALVFAVKKFHRYIFGRHFDLHTDHKPLLSIFGSKRGIPVHSANRLIRYANTLLGYDFEIKYINNASFAYADFVSGLMTAYPKPGSEDIVIAHIREEEPNFNTGQVEILSAKLLPFTQSDLEVATQEDDTLSRVKQYIETHWPSCRKQISNPRVAEYFTLRSELHIVNNCVFFGDRPIIPKKMRQELLEELHMGHPGASRMNALAREKCFWPGITQQISAFVQRCYNCAINAKAPNKEVLHPWPIPDQPWERLHVDFAEPVNSDYFLVVVDAHSNWPEVVRMRTTTAPLTCKALNDRNSKRYFD